MLEFGLLRESSRKNSGITALNFKAGDFLVVQGSFWQVPMGDCVNG